MDVQSGPSSCVCWLIIIITFEKKHAHHGPSPNCWSCMLNYQRVMVLAPHLVRSKPKQIEWVVTRNKQTVILLQGIVLKRI